MNKFLLQFSAVFVTALVVFGTDSDVVTAGPLGLFAAMLASLILTLADRIPARAKN